MFIRICMDVWKKLLLSFLYVAITLQTLILLSLVAANIFKKQICTTFGWKRPDWMSLHCLSLLTAQLSNMTMTTSQGSMLHLQSNMQHSPLGLNIINTHTGNVRLNRRIRNISYVWWRLLSYKRSLVPMFISQMSPFSMNGLPSPGYQCPTSVYQPTSQQVYSLTQTGQQVLHSKLMERLVLCWEGPHYSHPFLS